MTTSPPTASTQRIIALDVLRGLAILGTLLANIWIFIYVDANIFDIFASASAGSMRESLSSAQGLALVSMLAEMALGLVTDGKFIGLLTIMFGIGIEIQRQSALRKGHRWPGGYPWRAGLLILDGLLNYIFIFEFDVLMGYGLTALVVAAVLARTERTQKIWMWVMLTAHTVVLGTITAGLIAADRAGTLAEFFQEKVAGESLAVPHDSYLGQVRFRLENFVDGRMELPLILSMGIGLFLLGALLYRSGLFQPDGAKLRRWMMILGLGIGIPLDWGLRLGVGFPAMLFTRYVSSPLVAFGVLAAVASWYLHRQRLGTIGRLLTPVGRMALSCYILQNLLASIVFYNWGLGMAAKTVGPYQFWWGLALYVVLAGILVAFSWLWLRYFRRGPLEIIWGRAYAALSRSSTTHHSPTTETSSQPQVPAS